MRGPKATMLGRRPTIRAAVGGAVALAALCAALSATAVGGAQSAGASFGSTGAEQTFTVPAGVTAIQITATGAHGGDTADTGPAGGIPGGRGAQTSGTFAVTPGEVLYVEVGSVGTKGVTSVAAAAVFNGGGSNGAGAGGGATDVRVAPRSRRLSPDPRLIVAGGGGGSGISLGSGPNGGNGGRASSSRRSPTTS